MFRYTHISVWLKKVREIATETRLFGYTQYHIRIYIQIADLFTATIC